MVLRVGDNIRDHKGSVEGDNLYVNIDGNRYAVTDGDTVRQVDENNNFIGKGLRLQGVTSRETSKTVEYNGVVRPGDIDLGEVGGEVDRKVLYDYLRTNADNLSTVNLGEQTEGAGAGSRDRFDFINKDTGQGIAAQLAFEGLSRPPGQAGQAKFESNEIREARKSGELRRSAEGVTFDPITGASIGVDKDKFSGLRSLVRDTQIRDDAYAGFKGTALNEQWYNEDLHNDVEFRQKGVYLGGSRSGTTADPIGSAWDLGWSNVYADTGAFLHSLGVATGSEGLQEYGDSVRIRNHKTSEEAAPFAIQNLSDIETDEGVWQGIKDGVEWLGVNGTMSLPYMGAIAVAGTVAAATSPVSGTALLASAPAFALHAGTIWNDLDPENRTRANLGKVYPAALANTVLDRIGFAGILPAESALTKEGLKTLAKHVAKRDGIPEGQAQKIIVNTAKQETEKFLRHNASMAGEMLKRQSALRNAMLAVAEASPKEALTEALQEANSYITAQKINGDEIDDRQLLSIVANSAAAGFALGGTFGAAGSIPTTYGANRYRRRWSEEYEPEIEDSYLQAIQKEEDAAGIPEDKRDNATQLDEYREFANNNSVAEGYTASLAKRGESSNLVSDTIRDINEGEFEAGKTAARAFKSAKRVVKAATRNEISPEDMKNPALRAVYKLVDFNGGGGKNMENYRNYLQGTFQNIIGGRDSLKMLGVRASRGNVIGVSNKIRSLGNQGLLTKLRENDFNYYKLSETDRKAFNNSVGKLDPLAVTEVVRKMNNATETMWQTEYNSIVKEYGKNSKEAERFGKVPDYYWKKSEVDRNKVIKDPKGFEKFLTEAIKAKASDTNLTEGQRKALARMKPKDITNAIIQDGQTEAFSLVGGDKFAGGASRLLDLSERQGFADKFGEDNIFASLSQASTDTAKRVSSIEYFGDGGRILDSLFDAAVSYEINNNNLTEDQALRKVERIAADYKNIIDAASNNYRRIKNPTAAKAQRMLMTYTSFVGLPLAAAASIPEFGTMAFSVRNSTDAMNALKQVFNKSNLKSTVYRLFNAPVGTDEVVIDVDGKKEVLRSKVVQDEMFNTLEQIGIPVEVSDVYKKWGAEGSEPLSDIGRSISESFYKYSLIEPVTYLQRTMNAGFALDFMKDQLDILMHLEPGVTMNKAQGEASYNLQSLGMNVGRVMEILKKREMSANDLRYDTSLGTDAQHQAQSVSAIQETARANGISYSDQAMIDLEASRNGDVVDDRYLNEQVGAVMAAFINQNIQNPGAANRPLLFQDPRFALLTQFNGFISTVTTTLVPKLWYGKVGAAFKTNNPDKGIEAFSIVMTMVALGAMGQFIKDVLKGDEDDLNPLTHPYYDFPDLVERSFFASGIFGQFEKPLSWVLPTPFERDSSVGARAGSDAVGPNLRHAQNIQGFFQKGIFGTTEERPGGGVYESKPDFNKGLNELLKSVPGTSVHSGLRHKVSGFEPNYRS